MRLIKNPIKSIRLAALLACALGHTSSLYAVTIDDCKNIDEDAVFSVIYPDQAAMKNDLLTTLAADTKKEAQRKQVFQKTISEHQVGCFIQVITDLQTQLAAAIANGQDDVAKGLEAEIQQATELKDAAVSAWAKVINGGTDDSIDTSKPVSAFSKEELQKHIDSGELSRLANEQPLFTNLVLGTELSPEYEDGESNGFHEKRLFGRLNVDYRQEFNYSNFLFDRGAIHFGGYLDFRSQPVINCDKVDAAEQQNCKDGVQASIPKDFNDIADTLTAALKFDWNFYESPTRQIAVGIPLQYAMTSREKLTDNGDSINRYASWGLKVVQNDFQKNSKHLNGLPLWYISISRAKYYEDYQAINGTQFRTLVDAGVRVMETQPLYISLRVNGGTGPDEIGVVIAYSFKTEKLLGMFD